MPYQLVNSLDEFVADLCNLFKRLLNARSEKIAVNIRRRLCVGGVGGKGGVI